MSGSAPYAQQARPDPEVRISKSAIRRAIAARTVQWKRLSILQLLTPEFWLHRSHRTPSKPSSDSRPRSSAHED